MPNANERITHYTQRRLANGMHEGICGLCGRHKLAARSGMIAGWMAAHQGVDPALNPTCPTILRGDAA